MQTDTVLQIVSATVGLVASLFFSRGTFRQTADSIANQAGTIPGANPYIIEALSKQKADYLIGCALIVFVFVVQLLSYIVPSREVVVHPIVILLYCAVTLLISYGLHQIARRLSQCLQGKALAAHKRLATKAETRKQ